MKWQRKHHLRAIVLRALAMFAAIAMLAALVVQFVSRNQISDRLGAISQASARVVELQHESIHGELGSITSDLLFLARQNELLSYLETDSHAEREAAIREYVEIARQKGIYSQIRFLDDYGQEIIRVDFEDGVATVVPEIQLQSKGSRYYFIQTLMLAEGEIYVSPFDLNVEQGIIEEPRVPVIRFGTPVFDRAGQKRGIFLLTYLGENLLHTLGQATLGTDQKTLLTNWESYWLLGPDPTVEWGFMYYGTGVHTVDTSFPGAWDHLSSAHEGQFRIESGLFNFTTIHHISERGHQDADADHESLVPLEPGVWKLISFVPASVLLAVEGPIRQLWRIVLGFLLMVAAGISWIYARIRVLRAEHQARIEFMAKYDSLTGACNRHYFEGSIADEEARARRYKHAISFLMIDITRFKRINDTHGHQVGDEVLKEVSGILKGNVRNSDIVVRYGGDEFLIMFPEAVGEADTARERILQAIDEFNANQSRFPFPVILALGSAHWEPSSGETIEDTLLHADECMYEHKLTQHNRLDQGE